MTDVQCRKCKKNYEIDVTDRQIEAWQDGLLIQKAMPNISPAERELFISGFCSECWKKIFKTRH